MLSNSTKFLPPTMQLFLNSSHLSLLSAAFRPTVASQNSLTNTPNRKFAFRPRNRPGSPLRTKKDIDVHRAKGTAEELKNTLSNYKAQIDAKTEASESADHA